MTRRSNGSFLRSTFRSPLRAGSFPRLHDGNGFRGHVQGLTVEEHARLIDEALPLIDAWKRDLQPIIGTRRQFLGTGTT